MAELKEKPLLKAEFNIANVTSSLKNMQFTIGNYQVSSFVCSDLSLIDQRNLLSF